VIRVLLALVRPFGTIARELTIIRQLYEADLGSRERPVNRLTEQPSKYDTEVSYSGVVDRTPKHKRWFGADAGEEDEG
jgi:hypothetical protein